MICVYAAEERERERRRNQSGSNDQIAFVLVSKRSEPFLWYRFSFNVWFRFYFRLRLFGKAITNMDFYEVADSNPESVFFFIPAGCLEIYRWHERMWPE